jgi:hypothetical protein
MSLSELQQRIASLVFSLADADGFALAGGGALIAHHVVDRTTRDLDYFGPSRDAVDRLWPAIRDRLLSAGLTVDVRQSDHGFAKMSVTDLATGETTQVDIGFDPAEHASIALPIGPVRALDDLAGDKLLALFGRAAPRDFVDVHALRAHFSRRMLESLAAAKDLGFNLAVLRDAFGVFDDLPRSAFEVDDTTYALIRDEFQSWREELGDASVDRPGL